MAAQPESMCTSDFPNPLCQSLSEICLWSQPQPFPTVSLPRKPVILPYPKSFPRTSHHPGLPYRFALFKSKHL